MKRLGRVLARLGLILERPGDVLEHLGRVLECLGASGVRLQASWGRVNEIVLPSRGGRSSGGARGSPIIKTEETLRTTPYTENYLQRMSV